MGEKCRKSKKHHTRLLLSKTVRREKKEIENVRNLQGKIFRKMQKMRISPHFLQLIENDFVLFFCMQKVYTAFCRVS